MFLESGQVSNDYKSFLQIAKLSHGQQVVTIAFVRWQIQLSRASGQAEFRALSILIIVSQDVHLMTCVTRHKSRCSCASAILNYCMFIEYFH